MTADIPKHLSPEAAQLLSLSTEERIDHIRSPRWIGYPRTQTIIAKLEDLLTWPKSHRMPNLLIVGDTNNGKTMLVQRFRSRHPAYDNPEGQNVVVPVMLVQAPPTPDEGRFYNAILDLLFAPYRSSDRVERKQSQAIKLMQYVGLRMLIIDEIHHILAGNLNKQRAFLNVIKFSATNCKYLLWVSVPGMRFVPYRQTRNWPIVSNRRPFPDGPSSRVS